MLPGEITLHLNMKVFISSLITGVESYRLAAREGVNLLGHEAVILVGQFAPKYHGQFAPKQWVSLRRHGVVSFIIISRTYRYHGS